MRGVTAGRRCYRRVPSCWAACRKGTHLRTPSTELHLRRRRGNNRVGSKTRPDVCPADSKRERIEETEIFLHRQDQRAAILPPMLSPSRAVPIPGWPHTTSPPSSWVRMTSQMARYSGRTMMYLMGVRSGGERVSLTCSTPFVLVNGEFCCTQIS